MYGGFNDTNCQPCPENSVNASARGYLAESCACTAGHTGPDGGPCVGKRKYDSIAVCVLKYSYGQGTDKLYTY